MDEGAVSSGIPDVSPKNERLHRPIIAASATEFRPSALKRQHIARFRGGFPNNQQTVLDRAFGLFVGGEALQVHPCGKPLHTVNIRPISPNRWIGSPEGTHSLAADTLLRLRPQSAFLNQVHRVPKEVSEAVFVPITSSIDAIAPQSSKAFGPV